MRYSKPLSFASRSSAWKYENILKCHASSSLSIFFKLKVKLDTLFFEFFVHILLVLSLCCSWEHTCARRGARCVRRLRHDSSLTSFVRHAFYSRQPVRISVATLSIYARKCSRIPVKIIITISSSTYMYFMPVFWFFPQPCIIHVLIGDRKFFRVKLQVVTKTYDKIWSCEGVSSLQLYAASTVVTLP